MNVSTLALVLWLSAAPPDGPRETCQLTGVVELIREKRRVDARDAVVVYVKKVPAKAWVQEKSKHQVIQQFEQFNPRLTVVLKGEDVTFLNRDVKHHNVFSRTPGHEFNLGESTQESTGTHNFGREGAVHVQCNIHKSMKMDVLVVENPYFKVVGQDDQFALPPLPANADYEVVAWEPNGGTQVQVVKACVGKQPLQFRLSSKKDADARRVDGTRYPDYTSAF